MSGDAGDAMPGGGLGAAGLDLATALMGPQALVGPQALIGPQALVRDLQLAALGLASLTSRSAAAHRFRSYFPLLRRWFDLGDDGLSTVLAKIDIRREWTDAPFPGVRYFRFQSGPASAARQSGCLSLSPGALFPHHLHHGKERSLILQGSLLLDGVSRHVGEVIEAPAGSMHDFVAGPNGDLVLIVAHDGLSFSI